MFVCNHGTPSLRACIMVVEIITNESLIKKKKFPNFKEAKIDFFMLK
jgi:hypothetical protein